MKEITEYKIIKERFMPNLEYIVSGYISDGWIPQGRPFKIIENDMWYQAIVKVKSE